MANIMPKHIFQGMTYDQAVASDAARTKVVGNGPFIVDKVVPGESVTFKKNPYYYKGEPKSRWLKSGYCISRFNRSRNESRKI